MGKVGPGAGAQVLGTRMGAGVGGWDGHAGEGRDRVNVPVLECWQLTQPHHSLDGVWGCKQVAGTKAGVRGGSEEAGEQIPEASFSKLHLS